MLKLFLGYYGMFTDNGDLECLDYDECTEGLDLDHDGTTGMSSDDIRYHSLFFYTQSQKVSHLITQIFSNKFELDDMF